MLSRCGIECEHPRTYVRFMDLLSKLVDLFSGSSMIALLKSERRALDRIFGGEPYEITSSHRRQATIRLRMIDVSFGWERDGEIGSLIELRDPPAEQAGMAQTWLWGEFLGVEMPVLERDQAGRVRMPPKRQLEQELAVIARLMAEVFSDPQKLSEATQYVEDRTGEYNERFRGPEDGPD